MIQCSSGAFQGKKRRSGYLDKASHFSGLILNLYTILSLLPTFMPFSMRRQETPLGPLPPVLYTEENQIIRNEYINSRNKKGLSDPKQYYCCPGARQGELSLKRVKTNNPGPYFLILGKSIFDFFLYIKVPDLINIRIQPQQHLRRRLSKKTFKFN